MKVGYVNKINFKKLKKYPGKSLFLVLPITILILLGIVMSSQAKNIMAASQQAIFGTAATSGQLIELSSMQVTGGANGDQRVQMVFGGDAEYTDTDRDVISGINNVETAALTVSIPISQAATGDLFAGKSVSLTNLRTLDEAVSSQYTDQDFSYREGQPIPIILNAQTFTRSYEDWKGQTEVTIDVGGFQRGGGPPDTEAIENQTPIKFEAIPYDRDNLIGKEITISFGGLDPLQDYEQEFTGSGMLFRKLTDEQIQANEDERKSAIEPYWNYDGLNTPLTYTFKIVGVLENQQSFASYIPEEFASVLMNNYLQKQLDARTDKQLPNDLLNTTFYGMTYDGVELQGNGFGGLGKFIGGGPGGTIAIGSSDQETQAGYTIPGLVIETERQEGDSDAFQRRMFGSTGDVKGIIANTDVFDESAHSSDTMLIKVNDIANRSQAVKDLNDAGYAYQDLNDQEVFTELQNTMQTSTTVTTAAFVVLTALIVILTMGKFVSESRKEIGIFRAIGATKKDIKQLFIMQAVGYTFVGYIAGVVGGIALVFILAKPIQLWFEAFLKRTVGETFSVVQQTSAGVFTHIDWQMFGLYTLLLFAIALVISIIPATQASRVSPVQAMKNE